jgi:hypothetical protein
MAIDGTYNIEIDTPMGSRPGKLTLKTKGKELSGSLAAEEGQQSFTGGTVSGNEFAFSTELTTPMGKITLGFKGKVAGNEISGQVQAGEFGSSSFKGKKA